MPQNQEDHGYGELLVRIPGLPLRRIPARDMHELYSSPEGTNPAIRRAVCYIAGEVPEAGGVYFDSGLRSHLDDNGNEVPDRETIAVQEVETKMNDDGTLEIVRVRNLPDQAALIRDKIYHEQGRKV